MRPQGAAVFMRLRQPRSCVAVICSQYTKGAVVFIGSQV